MIIFKQQLDKVDHQFCFDQLINKIKLKNIKLSEYIQAAEMVKTLGHLSNNFHMKGLRSIYILKILNNRKDLMISLKK